MSDIHPTAIISSKATIAKTAKIGPYCFVGDDVYIGEHTILQSHVVVKKCTKIGQHNQIYQFASIGEDCQDLKYHGEETWLEIGDYNTIREACNFHRGTVQDNGITKIGNHNLFMVNTHIAHDCCVGNHNVLANNVALAGHVHVADHTIIGGNSAVHQFRFVDSYAIVGGGSIVLKDVPAFMKISGNPARAVGLNIEGMRRNHWSKQTVSTLQKAYKVIFESGMTVNDAILNLEELLLPIEPKIQLLIDSLRKSRVGVVRPRY